MKGKFEAICLTGEAWPELDHGTGQEASTQQQIYNRMAEQETNIRESSVFT